MPNLTQILFDAKNLARRERYHQAVRLYRKALDVDPTNEEALLGLGGCYYGEGDLERARHVWLGCLKIHPHSERAEHLLAKLPPEEIHEPTNLEEILGEPLQDEGIVFGEAAFRRRNRSTDVVRIALIVLGAVSLIMLPFVVQSLMRGDEDSSTNGSFGAGTSTAKGHGEAGPAALRRNGLAVNPFGINLEGVLGADADGSMPVWETAREVCGEWGHVRVRLNHRRDPAEDIFETVVRARAHRLIPIIVGPGPFDDQETGVRTGMIASVDRYRSSIVELNRRGVRAPYLELPDRPIRDREYVDYADWLVMLCDEVKRFAPHTEIIGGGLQQDSAGLLSSSIDYRPRLAELVDLWAVSSLPIPAAFYGRDEEEIPSLHAALIEEERGNRKFIRTDFAEDPAPILGRVIPTGASFLENWLKLHTPGAHSLVQIPSSLPSELGGQWPSSEWFAADGGRTEVYRTLVAASKPRGDDYLTRGDMILRGRAFDEELQAPVAGVCVAAFPGPYVARTDSDGGFEMAGIPSGSYRLGVVHDGYEGELAERVKLFQAVDPLDLSVRRTSLIPGDFNRKARAAKVPEGWTLTYDQGEPFVDVDGEFFRSRPASQWFDFAGNPGQASLSRKGRPLSAAPGRVYKAEVWVKSRPDEPTAVGMTRLALEILDSAGSVIAVGEARSGWPQRETGWYALSTAIKAPPCSSRLSVRIEAAGIDGGCWIDDVFVHSGDDPLPSELAWRRSRIGAETLVGVVRSSRNEPIEGASVRLTPGGILAITDEEGAFRFENLPADEYRVKAGRPLFESASMGPFRIGPGGRDRVFLMLAPSVFPTALIDGDFEESGRGSAPAGSWRRWGLLDGFVEGGSANPPVRAHRGSKMLGILTGRAPRRGGVLQPIGAEIGTVYEASCRFLITGLDLKSGWSRGRIGIDPTGGVDPGSERVVWSPWAELARDWERASSSVEAESPQITVFVELQQQSPASQIFADAVTVNKAVVLGTK